MGMRVRLGPVSLSSSGRVGVRAGPVSVYGGGRRRRRDSGGGFAAVIGLLLVVGLVLKYWYVALALLVVGGFIWFLLERARREREIEAARVEAERQRAWLAAPQPPLPLPSRFSERWFADNVPYLHPGQVPRLLDELRARGWKEDRIRERVGPFLRLNPYL